MENKTPEQEAEETATRIVINTEGGSPNQPNAPFLPTKPRARKVYGGMWGIPEMAVVGIGLFAMLATILLYVFFVLPPQKRLSDNRAKLRELDKKLTEANARYGSITTTQDGVQKLQASVDDFEMRSLPAEMNGKAAFSQQLNGLIAAYGLTNTAGPDYSPLEPIDTTRAGQPAEAGEGRSKLVSIYPGWYITVTLDGTYQNLRRFIREVETSNQFVVISTIELEPSDTKEKPQNQEQPQVVTAPQPQNFPPGMNPAFQPAPVSTGPTEKIDRGKMRGETVTLRLELATYFRR